MHLYPLLLFAIIVLSLLFLVMTGTGLYSAVVDSQTRNREARAAHFVVTAADGDTVLYELDTQKYIGG